MKKKLLFLCAFFLCCTIKANYVSAEEIGEPYEGTIEIGYDNYYLTSEEFVGGNSYYILSNGKLWRTYPQMQKVRDNVEKYQGGKIITFNGETGYSDVIYQYVLDTDGTLWNEDEKLALDVVKFTGNYALDEKGNLIDIFYGLDSIPNVKDWHDETESAGNNNMFIYTGEVYILTNDQTLWRRKVEIWDGIPEVSVMEVIMSGVQELNATSVLCADGRIYSYSDLENPIAENGARLTELGYSYNPGWREPLYAYYGTDNDFYIIHPELLTGQYLNLGKMDVIQMLKAYQSTDDSSVSERFWYILTSDGTLLKCDGQGILERVDSEVMELNKTYVSNSWLYKKNDGFYYGENGMRMGTDKPYVLSRFYGVSFSYKLVLSAGETDGILLNESQNDQEVIDYVEKVFGDPNATYVLRTDGTIWDVTGKPVMVLDFTETESARGDVDGSGSVEINDLRLVLRCVCGKIELTNQQKLAADVDVDGSVGIEDLRLILRYVCGKIDEL